MNGKGILFAVALLAAITAVRKGEKALYTKEEWKEVSRNADDYVKQKRQRL